MRLLRWLAPTRAYYSRYHRIVNLCFGTAMWIISIAYGFALMTSRLSRLQNIEFAATMIMLSIAAWWIGRESRV